MEYKNYITIIIYIVIFIFLFFLIPYELTNVSGVSWLIRSSKKDSKEQLKSKLLKTLYFDYAVVFWRRCLIFSVIVSIVLLFLILGRLPYSNELVLTILILYFFSYHFCILHRKNCTDLMIKEGTKTLNYLLK